MRNKRIFEQLPDFVAEHPKADRYRITRLETVFEEHLNECNPTRTTSLGSYLPTAILFLLYTLGGLGLVSPEKVAQLAKLFGH